MYRVSPALQRFAFALLAGAGLATVWVNLAPYSYFDFIEWRFINLVMPGWLGASAFRLSLLTLVGEALMALFVALIAKELWEALTMEHGPLSGTRLFGPLLLMTGAVGASVAVWLMVATLSGLRAELAPGLGWTAPIGGDVILCYFFGRAIFGAKHPALKLLLLVSIAETLIGLALSGAASAQTTLRPAWLILPLIAALAVWWRFGQVIGPSRNLQAHRRSTVLWPYVLAGFASWGGIVAAGLPGALGLLPVLPAIAHADRSFGLFAEAEGLLHDPLNRLAHLSLWPVTLVIFAFGLTFGAIDLSAFGMATIAMLAALWIGKPAGLFATAVVLRRMNSPGLLPDLTHRDLVCLLPLCAMAFTGPTLSLPWSLPQGIVADGARLGLAISLLAGPAAVLLARRLP